MPLPATYKMRSIVSRCMNSQQGDQRTAFTAPWCRAHAARPRACGRLDDLLAPTTHHPIHASPPGIIHARSAIPTRPLQHRHVTLRYHAPCGPARSSAAAQQHHAADGCPAAAPAAHVGSSGGTTDGRRCASAAATAAAGSRRTGLPGGAAADAGAPSCRRQRASAGLPAGGGWRHT